MMTNGTSKPLGPCPLCGGEAITEDSIVRCEHDGCDMSGWHGEDLWRTLSDLAEQNRRRGKALERLKQEFIHRNKGGSPMFHESNTTMIGWCEETMKP